MGRYLNTAAATSLSRLFRVGFGATEIPIISRWPVACVLILSGALGWHVGAGAFADWQVAVESAQVVARLVEYPAGNPFYVYHTKLWTILHQVLAVLLVTGVSERTLSVAVSGALGVVSFQALSLIAYALSGDVLIAAGASAFIFFTRVAEANAIYPIWLVGTSHTYGVSALSFCALVVGFLGCGWYRTGLFLLGVAPAVHPSLGAWLILIAAIVFVSDWRSLSSDLRPALPAFLAGCGATLASLAFQLMFVSDVPDVDPSTTSKYLAAFVSFWDIHRQPVSLEAAAVRVNASALVISLFFLIRRPLELAGPARLLMRFVAATATLSLVLALISWIPADRMPPALLIAMPGRVLNLNMLMVAALLIGLFGAGRRTWSASLLLLLLCFALVVGNRSGLWTFEGDHRSLLEVPAAMRPNATNVVLIGALVALVVSSARRRGDRPVVARAAYIATVTLLAWTAVLTWNLDRPRGFDMADRTSDVLFRMLSEGRGLLLTGGDLHLIQLRTRRPVLLDGGGLDALPYAIESAPEMERILREVYGVDLLNPPEEARYRGAVPPEFTKAVWQSYSRERWDEVANRFGVRQVLAPGDWDLKLPVAVRNPTLTVYDIPYISR
jgi:hypothetical protein